VKGRDPQFTFLATWLSLKLRRWRRWLVLCRKSRCNNCATLGLSNHAHKSYVRFIE